jgi:hypothetical protein
MILLFLSSNGDEAMTLIRWPEAVILVTALVFSALPAAADSVQLANGDVLNGRVLGLDDKQLRLESDTLGQVNIPRPKVVSITLGDGKTTAANKKLKSGTAQVNLSPEGVLKRLQAGGLNPKDIGDIQKMFPQLATPEASAYFNDTLKGLLGGTLSVGDIRKQAIHARDELKKATKGLGPDVEASVAPYLQILEKFIGETQPSVPQKKAEKAVTPKATPEKK